MDVILWGGIAWLTCSAALAFALGKAIRQADQAENVDPHAREAHELHAALTPHD